MEKGGKDKNKKQIQERSLFWESNEQHVLFFILQCL